MIVILPVSLLAQDTAAAMLRSNGIGVQVNKYLASASIARFPQDVIATQTTAVARIEASGPTADINSGSIVQFDINELRLERGSLSVDTSRGMRVKAGWVTVTPVNDASGLTTTSLISMAR
jgi:hypothetical protein